MRSAITQTVLILWVSVSVGEEVLKLKRSPLEVGFVTFTERPHSRLHHKLNHSVTVTKEEKAIVGVHEIVGPVKPAHSHKWVPGHVRQHAYIPAHLDHVYLPAHALVLARGIETAVLVDPDLYPPYRSHYGGFGIGVDMGGQGAGHGFHVVFDF